MNVTRGNDTATETLVTGRLQSLTLAQVLTIDRALASLGPFGEVRIVKNKGRVRFIETLDSRDILKIGDSRGDA